MDNTSSTKKIALITGGNRGIGLETARQLSALGILPVIGARTAQAGLDAVLKLKAEGLDAEFIVLDVTKKADILAAVRHFADKAGLLDILVNNAGVHFEVPPHSHHAPSTVPEQVLRDTMEANFFAPIAVTQAFLPLLRKAPAGRIVNLSSILGSLTLQADPSSPIYNSKSIAYDMSKTALNGFTVQLAYELRAETTKVNAAHPGWTQTDMGGSAAPMTIPEGARTSVMLATLPADGPSGGFFHLGDALPW